MISNHAFCEIVKAVRVQNKYIGKIEDALGVILEDAWKFITDVIDIIECEMDCGVWEDDIFDKIFDTDENPSDIYFYILNNNQKEKKENAEEE